MAPFACALLAACAAAAAQELAGPVVRVTDGDSIEVDLGGERERIRYIGIDAPEMTDARPRIRAAAIAARRANAALVDGRRVRLELDVEHRDRYGRLLAYVWVGDTLVNQVLVRAGHARPLTIPPNVKYAERFRDAARLARADEGPDGALEAEEAADRVGEDTTVCGLVAGTRYLRDGRREPTFLNLGRPYPDQEFTIVIWGADRTKFGQPERSLDGRRICVTGTVRSYRGRPEMPLTDPESLQVLETP